MNLLPPFSIRLSRREVLKHFAAGSLGAASLPNFASNEKLAAVSGITIRDDLGEHVFQTIPQRPAVLQWDLLENLVGLGVKPAGACDISSWDTWVREPAALRISVPEPSPILNALPNLNLTLFSSVPLSSI
jgi:hypothetical protein